MLKSGDLNNYRNRDYANINRLYVNKQVVVIVVVVVVVVVVVYKD